MTRVVIKPSDRVHMLVWKQEYMDSGDPHWCTAAALNGCVIESAVRWASWEEALDYALERSKS